MKVKACIIGILFFIIFTFDGYAQQDDFPVLKGPYLGQKPPGLKPEIFAQGIISTGENELCHGFLNEGSLFIFSRMEPYSDWRYKPTYFMELKDGKWTEPALVPFNDFYLFNFTVGPDDRTLYFSSRKSNEKNVQLDNANIWSVSKVAGGWSTPSKMESPVNTLNTSDSYPSVTKNGTLYFMTEREDGYGLGDTYRSVLENGKYRKVENIGSPANTINSELDPFISPDESYLIYISSALEGYGSHDLFITFKRQDGSWSQPINMGKEINTPMSENRPSITPDGKYFFFCRQRFITEDEWEGDIYWVDTSIIENLRSDNNR